MDKVHRSVSYLFYCINKGADTEEIDLKSIIFDKIAPFACVCAFFVVLRTLPIGNNSYLAMLERIFQYSPVATFAQCSPYSSSLEIL